jgi:polyhydroxybutyrate depolymerase
MTNRLACEAADVFAAVGTVAGAYTDFPGGCNPARPVPVVAFHGVTDPIVPYEGDERIHFPAIETWVQDWAKRDSCSLTPEAIPGTQGDVTGTRYTGCAGGAQVDFYSISDGGHTWPGGSMGLAFLLGKTTQDIDASETMWAFFAAHPMPQ